VGKPASEGVALAGRRWSCGRPPVVPFPVTRKRKRGGCHNRSRPRRPRSALFFSSPMLKSPAGPRVMNIEQTNGQGLALGCPLERKTEAEPSPRRFRGPPGTLAFLRRCAEVLAVRVIGCPPLGKRKGVGDPFRAETVPDTFPRPAPPRHCPRHKTNRVDRPCRGREIVLPKSVDRPWLSPGWKALAGNGGVCPGQG
jgi:hypothetical protein